MKCTNCNSETKELTKTVCNKCYQKQYYYEKCNESSLLKREIIILREMVNAMQQTIDQRDRQIRLLEKRKMKL